MKITKQQENAVASIAVRIEHLTTAAKRKLVHRLVEQEPESAQTIYAELCHFLGPQTVGQAVD